MQKSIIFYDSECIMCSRFVRMVFKFDKHSSIYFSSLDSALFKSIKQSASKIIPDQTVVFYKNETQIYYKSEAVFQICQQLKFPVSLLSVFNLLPTAFLNMIYEFIAVNRKRWVSNSNEKCSLIQAEFSQRILK